MKRLLLLRHAKAVASIDGDDFDRGLTAGGETDAEGVGDYIAAQGLETDFVLSSGARRTLDTARIVTGRWRRPIEAVTLNALYDATWRLILALLQDLPATASSALLVAHNPGVGDLSNLLTGDGDRDARLRMAAKYPTSGLAVIDFPVMGWSEIRPRAGTLRRFVTPADLGLR
jgi:phosphohistidine phosphatase